MLESFKSFVGWGDSLTRPMFESLTFFVGWEDSLTRPMLESLTFFVGLEDSLTRAMLESLIGRLSYPFHARISHVFRRMGSLLHAPSSNFSLLSSDGDTLQCQR